MIKAVFFDLYETLITEWEDGKKKATYSTKLLGLDQSKFKSEWDSRRELRMDGTFPDHQSVLRDILSSQGMSPNPEVIEKVHQARVSAKAAAFQEISGEVLELLQSLKDRGLKLGLISNAAPEEVNAWKSCNLANYFDEVIFSYEVRVAKPTQKIYQIACEKLGALAQESIFIGDGGANELVGAAEFDMKAYQATWFLPDSISDKITGFPKLKNPLDLLKQDRVKSTLRE
ncbi:HAD-IA family hydrolase [Fictibacillus sp. UD]|uniref:HAD family hydrolase n=1 Tax=Fictibacillus sp. UD TaxID=3038777 RepID=UPI003745ABFA